MNCLVKFLPGVVSRGVIVATLAIAISPSIAGNVSWPASELAIDTNWAEDTVSIINLRTQQEKSRIKVGAKPYDVKPDRDGRFAYASLSGGREISVIDLQSNLEADRILVGESPRDMIMTKDFARLIVANSGDRSISVVDLSQRKELFRVPVGLLPYGVALIENDRVAVVANWGEGTVAFVDLDKREMTDRIRVGSLPYTIVASEQKGLVFTAVFGEDKVAVIDIKTRKLLREVPVGASPWGLSATSSGDKLAVANFYAGSVSIISVENITQEGGITVETYRVGGKKPGDRLDKVDEKNKTAQEGAMMRAKHAVLSDDGTLMFTDLAGNTVNTVDMNTKKLTGSVKVGLAPYGIDFLPQGRTFLPAALTSR